MTFNKHYLIEFWYDLVISERNFLWVMWTDSIVKESGNTISEELREATIEKASIVGGPTKGGSMTQCHSSIAHAQQLELDARTTERNGG
ncbi:hypothetical protein NL676_007391 [Syzygium grande]|nr:hypothetical protein NL676_007391 [Syzygium grande]